MLTLNPPVATSQVLLHSCCAPCSSAIIECLLQNGLRPTVFYYNPNIYPRDEYLRRKEEAQRFVTSQRLDFVDADYDHSGWRHCVAGLKASPNVAAAACAVSRCGLKPPHTTPPHTASPSSPPPWLPRAGKTFPKSTPRMPGRFPLPRNHLLGTELAQRRTARTTQRPAAATRLLQSTVLRLRVQHEPLDRGGQEAADNSLIVRVLVSYRTAFLADSSGNRDVKVSYNPAATALQLNPLFAYLCPAKTEERNADNDTPPPDQHPPSQQDGRLPLLGCSRTHLATFRLCSPPSPQGRRSGHTQPKPCLREYIIHTYTLHS